jgi:2-polyprenyl-6-methoxyphenol hydroxylase-like FAD-dependent oxidoreductase
MSERHITIIGGGLAGLTLGIALRRKNIPATILEAGGYPRHRVCGEFISGHGVRILEELGIAAALRELGAISAQTAMFATKHVRSPIRRLASPALCISRFQLDAHLAKVFSNMGGTLLPNQRAEVNRNEEGCIRASGRRLAPAAITEEPKLIGLKVHLSKMSLHADLEMHSLPNGYVGLCRIEDETVNMCGLFERQPGTSAPGRDWVQTVRSSCSPELAARLATAFVNEETFCAVAGISLKRKTTGHEKECAIGDSFSMIPPVTGNGMSIAFESAIIAADPLSKWFHGQASWPETTLVIAGQLQATFETRLRWAAFLQKLMTLAPIYAKPAEMVLRSKFAWRLLYGKTR